MKNMPVMLVLVWVAALAWIALALVRTHPQPLPASPQAVAAPVLPSALAAAGAALARLEATPAVALPPGPLIALPAAQIESPPIPVPQPPLGEADARVTQTPATERAPERRLSFVLVGGDFRRALVDGKYVRTGSTLEDGGRIIDIHDDAVVVQDRFGRHVLRLTRALATDGSAWPARSP